LTPEFAALLVGLVVYTGAFIAEVMRAGILAVQKGQVEAAKSLGLSTFQTLRLVVLPLAMRVIIPPLISQYLNLTKNSSLAIVIGYADLFFVGRTIINQAGQAVPVFLLIMAIYLGLSLLTSAVLNVYNRRVQLVER
jgi:general L-amino acid transport system permease protein